jgi:hypothetical protein
MPGHRDDLRIRLAAASVEHAHRLPGPPGKPFLAGAREHLSLTHSETLRNGIVWLHYKVAR